MGQWKAVTPQPREVNRPPDPAQSPITTGMLSRQAERLKELKTVLVNSGLVSLDKQATALGLSRSTAWSLFQGAHKSSGLHPILIRRMLSSERLPPAARTVILTYIQERCRGDYGDSAALRHRFIQRLK